MKKYILTNRNFVYKRLIKNPKMNFLLVKDFTKVMASIKDGDEFVAPVCFKKHSSRCYKCVFADNFFQSVIKKETNSIVVCLFWRIFYRRITWNSKK